MRVTVKLFARLRDVTGTSDVAIDVEPDATIDAVWQRVVDRHPAVAPFRASLSCARNLEYARFSTEVAEGDEIAFLPPVSGG